MKGSGAELACTWVPRGHNAPGEGALVVRGGAIIMRVVSGETPTANLPKWAVVLVMIGGLLVALETVGEWGGGARAFALMSGQVANASLWHSVTLKTVSVKVQWP